MIAIKFSLLVRLYHDVSLSPEQWKQSCAAGAAPESDVCAAIRVRSPTPGCVELTSPPAAGCWQADDLGFSSAFV